MSNFFTRSKDDMKYLFKNKEELSKKERKRKRRGWGTLIGLIYIFIQISSKIDYFYLIYLS